MRGCTAPAIRRCRPRHPPNEHDPRRVAASFNCSNALQPLLDKLRVLAEKMNGGVVLLHHSRKIVGTPRESIRGSSALYNSCDTVFTLTPNDKTGTSRLEQIKARDGAPIDPLDVSLVDHADGGISLFASKVERNPSPKVERSEPERHEEQSGVAPAVLDFVGANPGCSQKNVRLAVKGRTEDVIATLRELEQQGRIRCQPEGNRKTYFVTES